jgi:hypothetical protein
MHKTAVNNVTRFSSSYLRRHVSKAGGSQRCSPKIMTAENNIHNACKGQQVCGISPILFNLLMLSCCLGFWIIQLVCSQAMDRKQPPGTDLLTSPVYLSYDRLALHHGSAANPSTTPPFMPTAVFYPRTVLCGTFPFAAAKIAGSYSPRWPFN